MKKPSDAANDARESGASQDSAVSFGTAPSRRTVRDPQNLVIICNNIARTLCEITAYPKACQSAQIELSISLRDFAEWIVREARR